MISNWLEITVTVKRVVVMSKTNAERQREWRDRQRGGQPVGRWPDGAAYGKALRRGAAAVDLSVETLRRYVILKSMYPEIQDIVDARTITIGKAFKTHKRAQNIAILYNIPWDIVRMSLLHELGVSGIDPPDLSALASSYAPNPVAG